MAVTKGRGSCNLGMREMKKEFEALRSFLDMKKLLTAAITEMPTMSQQLQKKLSENPLGPGELDFLWLKTEVLISSLEEIACRMEFWAGETLTMHLERLRSHLDKGRLVDV